MQRVAQIQFHIVFKVLPFHLSLHLSAYWIGFGGIGGAMWFNLTTPVLWLLRALQIGVAMFLCSRTEQWWAGKCSFAGALVPQECTASQRTCCVLGKPCSFSISWCWTQVCAAPGNSRGGGQIERQEYWLRCLLTRSGWLCSLVLSSDPETGVLQHLVRF
jgi:hypothetical protein